jgi:hypothetical protein
LQEKPKGPTKGRLATLRDENARFCAPKTRIPTPAVVKTVAVTKKYDLVSKIPSPKSASPADGAAAQQEHSAEASPDPVSVAAKKHTVASHLAESKSPSHSSPQACTPAFRPEQDRLGSLSEPYSPFDSIASEALQLSEELADQLAATPLHDPLSSTAESQETVEQPKEGPSVRHGAQEGGSPQVAGFGTPLDFCSALNLDAGQQCQETCPNLQHSGAGVPPFLVHGHRTDHQKGHELTVIFMSMTALS